MAITTGQTQYDEQQTRRSLLLGIAVLFVYLNVSYGLSSLSCVWGWFTFKIGGITGLQAVETVITLIALGLMLVLVYLPWREWRSFQTEKPTNNPHLLQDTEKD